MGRSKRKLLFFTRLNLITPSLRSLSHRFNICLHFYIAFVHFMSHALLYVMENSVFALRCVYIVIFKCICI
uniref:Uncharacterized protein n=1 Tax=Anguilla anguilla TaxID=7936 RepID=A0A0E9SJW8_ANGAN